MDSPAFTVLYDARCPVCSAAARRLDRWDRESRLELLPARSPEVARRFPGLSPEAMRESLHLLGSGGEVWTGADAVAEIAGLLPRWRWLRPLLRLPLVRPLARRVYRWVARNRYRLDCGAHCPVS